MSKFVTGSIMMMVMMSGPSCSSHCATYAFASPPPPSLPLTTLFHRSWTMYSFQKYNHDDSDTWFRDDGTDMITETVRPLDHPYNTMNIHLFPNHTLQIDLCGAQIQFEWDSIIHPPSSLLHITLHSIAFRKPPHLKYWNTLFAHMNKAKDLTKFPIRLEFPVSSSTTSSSSLLLPVRWYWNHSKGHFVLSSKVI